ncbi:MAG: hypothetical protein E5Y10_22095 [Mesorhizobium sp.]|uniref:hypothetical protein n=1 Tax=Mesorhizobium sp. TaxID=1871066 RepID=UPI001205A25A|nr:hypothetical protein [Mesorhizobium sp.]TIN36823.1 MAG: hypothetical protein E5Y13_22705 [Mesorhizobium sp.]TJU73573.1 MAG: hypothetical protein E5Y15_32685 [Mesorhizobium sp.]TJU86668.1 MAG: hypothetical protein E5Y10_22095 [Mesorhizobium sp.]
MTRPVRDIVAECIRRERYGLIRPLWADADDDSREEVRRRADHLIRLLADYGVQMLRTGEPAPAETPTGPAIVANQVYAQPDTMREVRVDVGKFSIVTVKAGDATAEQSFTLNEVMLNAGLVLADDPAAKTIKGLGRQLAAATEIYRLNAAGMGGGK